MEVTKIVEVDKKRFLIYIEYAPAFMLYKAEVRKFEIAEECEIKKETYDVICEEILPKRAMLRALHLLEKKDYTEYQLRQKLTDGYYPDEIIDKVVESVKAYGYINDYRYAQRYIEFKSNQKSLRRIKQDLRLKGIKDEVINLAIENSKEEGNVADEMELIKKLLSKRHYYESEKTPQEKVKQTNYLLGKGFDLGYIKKALNLDIED